MNVKVGTEAAQFPEKEYTMGFSLQCTHLKGVVGSKADQDTAQQLRESENSTLSLQHANFSAHF